ncbi:hypothetical protein BGZ79_006891 [Entomortierella chlamydospora]|nr:hypothetical protein BGZ79_006891 [Entomortierella chlamydospora]
MLSSPSSHSESTITITPNTTNSDNATSTPAKSEYPDTRQDTNMITVYVDSHPSSPDDKQEYDETVDQQPIQLQQPSTDAPSSSPSALSATTATAQKAEADGKKGSIDKKVHWKTKAWDIWMKNWFLLGLIVVIILARYFPGWGRTGGPIRPEYSVKYGITACIFLLSGLSLKTKDLLVSAMNYRAHLMVQLTSFIIIPLFVKALTSLFGLTGLNSTLLAGMAVTSATPTTISSNVVMTANSNGSEPLALFNAAFGNLLGVFISPLIVLVLLHGTPQSPSGKHGLDYATILRDLGVTILVPIIVGQIYLYFFPRSIAWAKKKVHFPTLNSSCLLILVWTVFCDAFYNGTFSSVNAGEIIAIGALQAFTFWIMTFFLGFIARMRPAKLRILKIMEFNQTEKNRREAQLEEQPEESYSQSQQQQLEQKDYSNVTQGLSLPRTPLQKFAEPISKKDTVAILFCGATKSVAMGIPMIKILYSSSSASALAGLLATPLLIYHVEQLFSGAFMVSWLKKWVNRGEETLETFDKKSRKKSHQPDQPPVPSSSSTSVADVPCNEKEELPQSP